MRSEENLVLEAAMPLWTLVCGIPAAGVLSSSGKPRQLRQKAAVPFLSNRRRQISRRALRAAALNDGQNMPDGDFVSEAEYKALLQGIETEVVATDKALAVTSNDVMGVTTRDTTAQKEVRTSLCA